MVPWLYSFHSNSFYWHFFTAEGTADWFVLTVWGVLHYTISIHEMGRTFSVLRCIHSLQEIRRNLRSSPHQFNNHKCKNKRKGIEREKIVWPLLCTGYHVVYFFNVYYLSLRKTWKVENITMKFWQKRYMEFCNSR